MGFDFLQILGLIYFIKFGTGEGVVVCAIIYFFMGKKLKKFQLPQSTLQRFSLIFFFLKIKIINDFVWLLSKSLRKSHINLLHSVFGSLENQKEKLNKVSSSFSVWQPRKPKEKSSCSSQRNPKKHPMALIQPLTQNCHQPPYQTPNVYSATPKIQLPNRQFAIIRIDARKNKRRERERESAAHM